jgi:hypothetical protein
MSDRIGYSPVQFVPFRHLRLLNPIDEKPSIRRVAMNPVIYRLSTVHRKLDEEIRRELKRRAPDAIRLLRLKKLKLAVKDRLHRHVPVRA